MADENDFRRPDDGEDEDEEEIDEASYKTVKDAVLFAIDVSKSMLKSTPISDSKKTASDSATIAALKCAYQLMQQRIISNPNDLMGVLLYGTEQSRFSDADDSSSSGAQYPHCYLLTDLDVPSASDVKRLRALVDEQEEADKLLVPSSEPVAMSNVLFCANQIFMTKAPNFSSRRLFLVTDDDSPHGQSKELRSSAVVRAKDLYDLGVTIELFPISRPDHEFDTSRFYDDIVYRPPSDPEAPAPMVRAPKPSSTGEGISLLTSLLTSIHSKMVAKRALFSNLPLELGPGMRISVKGYIIFKRQVPLKAGYVWLDGETPVLVTGKTNTMAEDTGRSMQKLETRRAYKFGGEQVLFKPEELTSILNFGDPIIRIIGFKPLSMLPIWANLKPSTFIYPSEEDYIGSTRTFAALQQTLLAKKKMGLVWYITRRNAAPVLAALTSGAETIGSQGEQVLPPGMWLTQLPFADDIRQNPDVHEIIRAPDDLKDKMRLVIQQLQLPGAKYDPTRYPNPALQWHYRILQALALDEDLPEKPEDKTLPRYRQIDKRAGAYTIEWGNALQAEFEKWKQEHGSSLKRVIPSGSGPPKKAKPAAEESSLSNEEMRNHVNKNTLGKLTLPQLKGWLKDQGLALTGKKADLVERVEGFFETKMQIE